MPEPDLPLPPRKGIFEFAYETALTQRIERRWLGYPASCPSHVAGVLRKA